MSQVSFILQLLFKPFGLPQCTKITLCINNTTSCSHLTAFRIQLTELRIQQSGSPHCIKNTTVRFTHCIKKSTSSLTSLHCCNNTSEVRCSHTSSEIHNITVMIHVNNSTATTLHALKSTCRNIIPEVQYPAVKPCKSTALIL